MRHVHCKKLHFRSMCCIVDNGFYEIVTYLFIQPNVSLLINALHVPNYYVYEKANIFTMLSALLALCGWQMDDSLHNGPAMCNSKPFEYITLLWRHNGRDSVSNHQPHGCLLNRLFRRISKKTSKLRVTGLCAGNSPVTGEFPAQMASNAENVSIWWHHYVKNWIAKSSDIHGITYWLCT